MEGCPMVGRLGKKYSQEGFPRKSSPWKDSPWEGALGETIPRKGVLGKGVLRLEPCGPRQELDLVLVPQLPVRQHKLF